MKSLICATRSSQLALAQAYSIIRFIHKFEPNVKVEIKRIESEGDVDRKTALWNFPGTGFFTVGIDRAVLGFQADFSVHSLKDLPTDLDDGLVTVAIIERQWPEDCVVTGKYSFEELPSGAKVGTSSLRRTSQLKCLRPDLEIVPVRGNVNTRLGKLDRGEYDALILARAGLERIGFADKIDYCFDPWEFLPAPGQGALAVRVRSDNDKAIEFLGLLNHSRTALEVAAERKLLGATGCGCHAPLGAYAENENGQLMIKAFIGDIGTRRYTQDWIKGSAERALELADRLADKLLNNGGAEMIRKFDNE